MKTKLGFMHKFAYSFFNFKSYKEFLVQGFGKSILYLFLVTLIFSTMTNINLIGRFNSEISSIQTTFANSAPSIKLENGLLFVDSNDPIYYKRDGRQLIVDTSGKTSKSILDSYSDGVYIDSNEITIRQNYNTLQTFKFTDFSRLTESTLTNSALQSYLSILKFIFPIVLLIFSPILAFFMNLISGFLILGPISLNISSIMGVKLKYSKACILAFYAMTLPLMLESLLNISGMKVPLFSFIFYFIALIYCGLAINEIKNTDKSNLNFTK